MPNTWALYYSGEKGIDDLGPILIGEVALKNRDSSIPPFTAEEESLGHQGY